MTVQKRVTRGERIGSNLSASFIQDLKKLVAKDKNLGGFSSTIQKGVLGTPTLAHVKNDSGEAVERFKVLEVTGPQSDYNDAFLNHHTLVGKIPDEPYDPDKTYVIPQRRIASQAIGSCVIFGATIVKVEGGDGNFVRPNSDGGLEVASDGPFKIIDKQDGDGEVYALVIPVGGGGSFERRRAVITTNAIADSCGIPTVSAVLQNWSSMGCDWVAGDEVDVRLPAYRLFPPGTLLIPEIYGINPGDIIFVEHSDEYGGYITPHCIFTGRQKVITTPVCELPTGAPLEAGDVEVREFFFEAGYLCRVQLCFDIPGDCCWELISISEPNCDEPPPGPDCSNPTVLCSSGDAAQFGICRQALIWDEASGTGILVLKIRDGFTLPTDFCVSINASGCSQAEAYFTGVYPSITGDNTLSPDGKTACALEDLWQSNGGPGIPGGTTVELPFVSNFQDIINECCNFIIEFAFQFDGSTGFSVGSIVYGQVFEDCQTCNYDETFIDGNRALYLLDVRCPGIDVTINFDSVDVQPTWYCDILVTTDQGVEVNEQVQADQFYQYQVSDSNSVDIEVELRDGPGGNVIPGTYCQSVWTLQDG